MYLEAFSNLHCNFLNSHKRCITWFPTNKPGSQICYSPQRTTHKLTSTGYFCSEKTTSPTLYFTKSMGRGESDKSFFWLRLLHRAELYHSFLQSNKTTCCAREWIISLGSEAALVTRHYSYNFRVHMKLTFYSVFRSLLCCIFYNIALM